MNAKRSLFLISVAALAGAIVLAGSAPSDPTLAAKASQPIGTGAVASFHPFLKAEDHPTLQQLVSSHRAPKSETKVKTAPGFAEAIGVADESVQNCPIAVVIDSAGPSAQPGPDARMQTVQIRRTAEADAKLAEAAAEAVAAMRQARAEAMLTELELQEILLSVELTQ